MMKDTEMMHTSLRRFALGALLAVSASTSASLAFAQAEPAQQPQQPAVARSEVGHATIAWLDLQRGNTAAAPVQPMLGEEAGLAYKRYMQSFKSKIPDLFGSAVSQGSGGGGLGGGMAGQSSQY